MPNPGLEAYFARQCCKGKNISNIQQSELIGAVDCRKTQGQETGRFKLYTVLHITVIYFILKMHQYE